MPRAILFILAVCLLSSCGSNLRYTYRYEAGKTATVQDGHAIAPADAPAEVHAAIAAGNRIAGSPYERGGGHGSVGGTFDCSGATSYVLREAGLMRGSMPSVGFRKYERSGEGEWISVWARKGHVFLVVAGLRFDTGWHSHEEGPRWTTKSRTARGYVIRHPRGM